MVDKGGEASGVGLLGGGEAGEGDDDEAKLAGEVAEGVVGR